MHQIPVLLLTLALTGAPLAQPEPALPAPAQTNPSQGAPLDPGTNAAEMYRVIWSGQAPGGGSAAGLFESNFLSTMRIDDAAWHPPADAAAQLEAAQPEIRLLMQVAGLEKCDWGNDMSRGLNVRLPYIEKMRVTVRVLAGDARRLAGKGDFAGAAERLGASVQMGRHVRSDRLVFSSRSGMNLTAAGITEIQRLAKAGSLKGAARETALAALRTLDTPDPIGLKNAIADEPMHIKNWVRPVCTGPQAGRTFFQEILKQTKQEDRERSGIEQMDEAALFSALDRLDGLYRDVLSVWDAPDVLEQLKAINQQREEGAYGPAALLFGTELRHLRVVLFRFKNSVAAAIKDLDAS